MSDENTAAKVNAQIHQFQMGPTEEAPNNQKRPKKLKLENNGDPPG
jgi:hypothetical protein